MFPRFSHLPSVGRPLAIRGPKLFIHLPVEAIVSHLIGNLVDGGYWRVTPEGPEPVAPWTGPRAAQARAAHRQIIEGLRALETLAHEAEGPSEEGTVGVTRSGRTRA